MRTCQAFDSKRTPKGKLIEWSMTWRTSLIIGEKADWKCIILDQKAIRDAYNQVLRHIPTYRVDLCPWREDQGLRILFTLRRRRMFYQIIATWIDGFESGKGRLSRLGTRWPLLVPEKPTSLLLIERSNPPLLRANVMLLLPLDKIVRSNEWSSVVIYGVQKKYNSITDIRTGTCPLFRLTFWPLLRRTFLLLNSDPYTTHSLLHIPLPPCEFWYPAPDRGKKQTRSLRSEDIIVLETGDLYPEFRTVVPEYYLHRERISSIADPSFPLFQILLLYTELQTSCCQRGPHLPLCTV